MDRNSNSTTTIVSVEEENLGNSTGVLNNNDTFDHFKEPAKTKQQDKVEKEAEDFSLNLVWIPTSIRKYTGLILTLIASLFLSINVLIVKVLNGPEYGFHSYSASFWRYLGVMLPSIPLLILVERHKKKTKQSSIFATVWPIGFGSSKTDAEKWWTIFGLVIRGLLGASSVILRYYSLEYLTIGDASVITYATPVLVTVMAHFCLGEKSGVIPNLAAIATFVGVLVMTRPPFLTGQENFDTRNLIGIGLATGSLICSALIVIITRKIRRVDFSLMTLVFGFIGVVQAFVLTEIFSVFQCPVGTIETLLIIALMSLSFFGQMSIIMALRMEQAGPVSLLRSCDVVFAFLLQFIFLGVVPDALSAVGGLIVITCISVTAIRKWLSTLPEDDEQRRRYKFLLI